MEQIWIDYLLMIYNSNINIICYNIIYIHMFFWFLHFTSCYDIRIYEAFSKIISFEIFSNRIWWQSGPLFASALKWRSGSEVAFQLLYIWWKLLSGVEWTRLRSMEGRRKPGISCIHMSCLCFLVHLSKALQGLLFDHFLKMTVIRQTGSCRSVTYCNTTSIL